MSYLVLARKLRPARFKDLIGQEPIWKTLLNALEADRVAHAFLFTGPRGTGKTSCARILTKALNCQSPQGHEPCNQCDSCQEINKGVSQDVMEIDAASNRGIEHIRELRESVKFSPAKARYKTYIIDEVHMLTTESFNALLKTLEEPPSHVKFILATTDVHKIPLTVISRCQRFDFAHIPLEAMMGYLQEVAQQEGIQIGEASLRLVARRSNGGMRDALTTLDMLISFCGNQIEEQEVLKILGLHEAREVDGLMAALINKDLAQALTLFDQLVKKGRSLTQLLTDLLRVVKDLCLIKELPPEGLHWVDLLPDQVDFYRQLTSGISLGTLQTFFQILLEVEQQIKKSAQAKICVEMGLVRLAGVENLQGIAEVISLLRQGADKKKSLLH